MHLRFRARLVLVAGALAALLAAGVGWAALVPGGPPSVPVVSNFGRLIAPHGRITRLSFFPTGAAQTPDGRFLWTVSAGRYANVVQITRLSDGAVVDKLVGPAGRAYEGGIAIAADGTRAYVAETHDKVVTFDIDRRSGHAKEGASFAIPVAPGAQPPDDFPPRTSGPVGYPSGLALSKDGRTLVVALNLDDHVALIDTTTGAVTTQVAVRPDGRLGDHAYPREVAIAGSTVLVTDEGDGTIASFPLSNPSAVRRSTPRLPDDDPVDAAKRHPDGIVAAPDGRSAYVSLTSDDRVVQVETADPSHVLASFSVRRAEGLGSQPTGLALGPKGETLFVADAGEDVVRAFALTSRRGVHAGDELARIPTGIYPDAVAYSATTRRLAIVSAKGTGPGPVIPFDQAADNDSVSHRILGLLQTLPLSADRRHADAQLRALGRGGRQTPVPVDRTDAPPATPLVGPGGGASAKIKYVFYVVAENKTYDTMFGDLPQGDGDPCLVVYGARRSAPRRRDGSPCPQDGFHSKAPAIRSPGRLDDGTPVTPNQHALASTFATLDHTFSDAETSDDGHNWASGGYTSDFEMRQSLAENSPAPRPAQALVYPVAQPPRGYLFDAAARQGISFHNYGEALSGIVAPDSTLSPAEQAVRQDVLAHSSISEDYPSDAAIDRDILPPNRLVDDSIPPHLVNPAQEVSRMAFFKSVLDKQLLACPDPASPATCAVPQFNELTFPNNHTGGTGDPTRRTPDALVRDNDLAIGQLVDTISHSKIWPYSAIFVIQDDAQDGADHVEGHRIAALVASPYAKRRTVVPTHYDTMSVLTTMERILGMRPSYMFDALGAPMWDAFTSHPDLTPFDATPIDDALLTEHNAPGDPSASLSRKYTWRTDAVPEDVVNRVQWIYRYGTARSCPRGGHEGVKGDPCGLGETFKAARRPKPRSADR